MQEVFSNYTASIADLQKDPLSVLSFHEPVAVLNSDHIVGYCVPTDFYDKIMDILEDLQFAKIIKSREGQKTIKVEWDNL